MYTNKNWVLRSNILLKFLSGRVFDLLHNVSFLKYRLLMDYQKLSVYKHDLSIYSTRYKDGSGVIWTLQYYSTLSIYLYMYIFGYYNIIVHYTFSIYLNKYQFYLSIYIYIWSSQFYSTLHTFYLSIYLYIYPCKYFTML